MRNRLDQQKRQHRERAQPANRQRLGLLEKHKDYVKRAKDYHSKEDRIRKLRQKAATRNQDEFYFGMVNSRTKGGVHIQDRGNEPMPVDVVKLLKTQDAGYVRTLISTEEKIIQRLKDDLGATIAFEEDSDNQQMDYDSEEEDGERGDVGEGTSKSAILSLLGGNATKGKKTIFVDTAKEVTKFKPSKLLPKVQPQATISKKKKGKQPETDSAAAEALAKERKAMLKNKTAELAARLERLATLQRTYREMQVQRLVTGKGAKNVVGGRKKGLSAEDERLNEGDLDELELRQLNSQKKKLPEPDKGVTTGARVWKWKAERRR